MNIRLLLLGKNKDSYIEAGISDWVKKLKAFCSVEITYIKDERVHNDIGKVLDKEAERIINNINPNDFVVVLDEHGKSFSSEKLSAKFEDLQIRGENSFTFIIGSAHGLSLQVKESADLLLSLGPLTMNHQIVRLVLLEQIYRIFTIQRGLPYHK